MFARQYCWFCLRSFGAATILNHLVLSFTGFSNALSGFGISLLGAVAGLVDHSINNIQKADTAKDAFKGAAKGLGKGLVGMFAKPIGGAMELLSQTGQGILLGTGLTKPPKKLRAMLENEEVRSLNKDSHLMYSW